MVTAGTLRGYDFKNLEDYFGYIVESRINGQHKQARELFRGLDDDGMQGQRAKFFRWLEESILYEGEEESVLEWKFYLNPKR